MLKIYIWGTGKIAKRLLDNGLHAEVLGFIETSKGKEWFCNKKVYNYTEIPEGYDAIIVANRFSNEIYASAREQKLDMAKMIFMFPYLYVDEGALEWVSQVLGQENYAMYMGARGFYDMTFYARDKECYNALNKRDSFKIDEAIAYPIIDDKYANAGTASNYFWQDLWAARLIYNNCPNEHFDIGSRLDGFIAHVLSYGIPVNMIDIRPFPTEIYGLKTIVDDATYLKQFEDNSIESLSALCSLEHFGLGRYGDPIDPEACFKCFASIQKKMKKGGKLYISVPIGKERLEFNAHRIFYTRTIIESFNQCRLLEFSCTADGKLEKDVELRKYDNDTCHRGTRFGLFYFQKD